MKSDREFRGAVADWLGRGSDATPPELIDAVLLAARGTPQERDLRISWRTSSTKRRAYAAAVVAVLAVSVAAVSALSPRSGIGSAQTPPVTPPGDLGIFEPVAGRIIYRATGSSLMAIDPNAPGDSARKVELASGGGIPLGWSGDGTRLLLMRQSTGGDDLFVVHADGSETQVTERPMKIRGATISPDGSRVVFAATTDLRGCCGPWAVYATSADGGPAEILAVARIGILEGVSFSPDGTRIAYADGAGDNNHHVWVMDADGSDAHEVASRDCACHVHGLEWSPAGDRIALGLEGTIYTFATDGSGLTQPIPKGDRPYWSPDGSQIAYTITCGDLSGCGLAIADADGSHVRTIGGGSPGPWHPGKVPNRPGG